VPRLPAVLVAAALIAGGTAGTALAAAPTPVNLDSASCPANMTQYETDGCVTELQTLLNIHNAGIGVDGQFGPQTLAAVRQFQSEAGIGVDGQVGPQTKAALYGSSGRVAPPVNRYSSACPSNMLQNEKDGCVVTLQSLLNAHGQNIGVDGQFGPQTVAAVRAFQTSAGIGVDGEVGPQTKHALYGDVSGSGSYTGAPTPILLDSPACPDVMAQGEIDGCVTELQSELNLTGDRLAVDGQFGPATFSAVESFQRVTNLTVSGTVSGADKDALIKAGAAALNGALAGAQAALEYNALSEAKRLYNLSKPIPYAYGAGHGTTPGETMGKCDASVDGGYLNGVCYGSSTYGLDCSGFTRYVYYLAAKDMDPTSDLDLGVPESWGWDSATSGQMLTSVAHQISSIDLRPGDLVFFGKKENTAMASDHVVMYAGKVNGVDMVYAEPTTGKNLSYEPLQPIIDSFVWTDYYHMAVFS